MKTIAALKDLFIEQGKELYNSQEQEINILTKFRKSINSEDLREIVRQYIKQVWRQQGRLENAFDDYGIELESEHSEPFGALINKRNQWINKIADTRLKDIEIVNAIQHFNHFKIAGYIAMVSYANELEDSSANRLFSISLEEERKMDRKMTKLTKQLNHEILSPSST